MITLKHSSTVSFSQLVRFWKTTIESQNGCSFQTEI